MTGAKNESIPKPLNKGKCKRCGLEAKALSLDGYCMACTGEILRERNPGMNIHFAGDMAELANKQQEV